ncbi:unnamed protein product [Ectocarpus sp. CCAP 1310/34]|nr:unnamed protein product [Ectocarpus sp. CCAP 1310/34]
MSQALASLIYSASTLHAAVNFPQTTTISFAPSNPASVYVPPPTDKGVNTYRSVARFRLGDYEANQFSDQRVLAPLAKSQQALEDIETDMVDE